tara:strand:- start:38768 stop:38956 length:189 start_codon:yes stop_codon:yes gene_type:complete
MEIKMNVDAHHRINGATSQHFRADGGKDGDGVYSVPKATGDSLIKRNVAAPVGTKPLAAKDA